MDNKRKSTAPDAGKSKRQRLETPTLREGSSSGLSSVHSPPQAGQSVPNSLQSSQHYEEPDSDSDAPLSEAAVPAQNSTSGKRPKATSSAKTPYSGSYPQTASDGTATPERSKTSQKGVGMARTVVPGTANPEGSTLFNRHTMGSSPDVSLAKVQQRHKDALQAETAEMHKEQRSVIPSKQPRRVKAEEMEETLDVLAQGMPMDANAISADLAKGPEKERPAMAEERQRIIVFRTVSNSELPLTPATLIILTGLKNIFQKQLPKMPREYIARLVFDREHWSMAIVKRGYQVVGGITYRPFEQRGFAEIVFCAITGTEQVRGYGSHLMNHLKDYVRSAHPGINHFLTYADNYAVGYFKKQGFTKEVTLDRSLWAAYIKDYEGGTLMQCTMLPRISYLEAREMLVKQKEAILAKIRQVSRSHIVHRGRDVFPDDTITQVDPNTVPGLKDVGWNPALDELSRKPQRGPQFMIMQKLLTDLQAHPSAWPFMKPVNKEEVQDYYEVIKNPMDLETMEVRLEANHYEDLPSFLKDAQYIFDNCRSYNSETSNYSKNATRLEKYLKERVKTYIE